LAYSIEGLSRSRPLPIAAKIDARLVTHGERHDPVNLRPVRLAAMILAPRWLLREADQLRAGDMVVVEGSRSQRSAILIGRNS